LTQKPEQLHLTDDEGAASEGFLRAHSTIMRALSAELEQADRMSMSSYDVLIHLARAPKRRLRMAELAEAVVLSPSGLTRLVERLEREGLVARIKSTDDARGAYATLTDLGRARLRKATRSHLTGIRHHFLSQLTPPGTPSTRRYLAATPHPAHPRATTAHNRASGRPELTPERSTARCDAPL
jgi:DNA-binding MarR family transcriptional regulator